MKQHAPATDRNRDPILAVLRDVLPPRGLVLEVASGTGQHAVYFARLLPGIEWQPTDPDPVALDSIGAWRAEASVTNLLPPLLLDVTGEPWPIEGVDAVVCSNMIHIAPWAACEALLAGAARLLPPGAPLILYGPFFREDVPTAASNLSFDASLRARNPAWGVRELRDVQRVAEGVGLRLDRVIDMPSNNACVILRREES